MSRPIPWSDLQRLCLLRTDHIGDLICSVPFMKAVRRAAPRAHITALVRPAAAGVLQGASFVDSLLSCTEADQREVMESLRAQSLDLALTMSPRTASYKLVRQSLARYRAGYVYASRPLCLLTAPFYLNRFYAVNLDKRLRQGLPVGHEVEILGEFARYLGLDYSDQELELPLDQGEYAQALQTAGSSLTLHLQSDWLLPPWDKQDLLDLLRALRPLSPTQKLVLTYGPAEKELAQTLAEAWRQSEDIEMASYADARASGESRASVIWGGDLSFATWCALLKAAALVLTPDTGALHVASALKRPVVAVYKEATASLCMQQWSPWRTASRMLVHKEARPTIADIIKACREMLAQRPASEAPCS